jgi:ABC-type lipoprotein release transport system permease subunit
MILVFAAIAITASWVPAHRAATLDPMVALREE